MKDEVGLLGRSCGYAKLFRLCVRLIALVTVSHCFFIALMNAQVQVPAALPDLSSHYAFTSIDMPAVGFWYSFPVRINDNDQLLISGYLIDAQGRTAITYPGAFQTYPTGLNNRGQVVGTYRDLRGVHGFFFDGSGYKSFNCPYEGYSVRVQSINAAGSILGSCRLAPGFGHAFRYNPVTDTFEQMYFPYNTYDPEPWGINDAGEIVGAYWDSIDAPVGFVLAHGNFSEVTPSASPSDAFCLKRVWLSDINTRGQIVGSFLCGSYSPHKSVIVEQLPGSGISVRATIAVPGSTTTDVTGINTRGQIVGQYTNADGIMRFFFGDPIGPVPSVLPQ